MTVLITKVISLPESLLTTFYGFDLCLMLMGQGRYGAESSVLMLRHFSRVQLCNPMPVAHEAPLSVEFSRQEYWSELPFSSPGDPPDPGIEPKSPALQADSLTLSHQGNPTTNLLSERLANYSPTNMSTGF